MNITIRQAVLSDSTSLVPLLVNYVGESTSKRRDLEASEYESWVTARIASADGIYFLALVTDQVVGFAALFPIFDSISLTRQWSLNDLFVLPEFRGNAIAANLLEIVHRYAKESGATCIELETAKTNTISREMYRRRGYYESSEYSRFYLDM